MNCANHPDVPVSAYCQNCGKPLCAACVRSVGGVIYCEQCLAARLGIPGVPSGASPVGAPGVVPGVVAQSGPSPATAFVLGFIPGVGAMYNGQFIKGIVHVLVFVILIGITNQAGIFGLLIAAWVAYQVFDAYHTAKARREGTPLPDPFGLNELGAKMGIHMGGPGAGVGAGPVQGFAAGTQVPPVTPGAPPAAAFTNPYAPYSAVPPPIPAFDPMMVPRRREPVGAIVLIGLGVLFLLNTLDVFHFGWIWRLWPLLIIGLGALMFVRRTREIQTPPPPPPPPAAGGTQ